MYQLGIAWVILCLAFALHILDEALNDFLSVYNPTARAIRMRYPFIPLPTFAFSIWFTLLLLGLLFLFLLSPLAFHEVVWMWPASCVFATIMFGNGLLHIGASLWLRRAMPGVYSSPTLVLASIYLLASLLRH
jgi:hypothetical protein